MWRWVYPSSLALYFFPLQANTNLVFQQVNLWIIPPYSLTPVWNETQAFSHIIYSSWRCIILPSWINVHPKYSIRQTLYSKYLTDATWKTCSNKIIGQSTGWSSVLEVPAFQALTFFQILGNFSFSGRTKAAGCHVEGIIKETEVTNIW